MSNVTFNIEYNALNTANYILEALKPKTPRIVYMIFSPNSFVKIKFHFCIMYF